MGLKVERYERIFLYATAVVLVAAFVAIIFSVAESGIHLPEDYQTIDPAEVDETPPFDQPGVFQTGPNSYEAVIVAGNFAFNPATVTVPAGAEVTFIVTSIDVTHGFMIPRTEVNVMVIPGQVTRVSTEFPDPGEHQIICHEFCGIGHHNMFGKVVVEG